MRLIDADELLELYEGFEDMGLKVPVEVVVQNIKDMPTAYDIDKVVEQLEENFLAEKNFRAKGCWLTAIEIVKEGGVSDEESKG